MKSIILFLVLIVVTQFFYGCISFYEYEGTDPLALVDSYPYPFSKFERADAYCINFNETLKGTKLRKDNELHKRIELILHDVELFYKQLSNTNLFSFYNDRFNCSLNIYDRNLCPKININIYSICKPLAVSYPNGEIHFSRAFIDGDLPFSAKNIGQLTGLIAHEFVHIKHGHLRYQWTVADAFNRFKNSQRKTNWSKYLRFLPISYSKMIYSNRDLSEIYFIDYHLECMADFYAAIIMSQMGYDIEEYVKLLINLHDYMQKVKNPNKRKIKELSFRISSLKNIVLFGKIPLPKYLIIERRNWDEEKQYFKYSFSQYPMLKKFAIYWTAALNTMGKLVYTNEFVFYPNNIAMPIKQVRQNNLMLKTSNGYIKPLEISHCIVIPEKLIEIPLFPFLYK